MVNAPFLKAGGSLDAGIDRALAKDWLTRYDSGTCVKFTEAGAALSPNGRFGRYYRFLFPNGTSRAFLQKAG